MKGKGLQVLRVKWMREKEQWLNKKADPLVSKRILLPLNWGIALRLELNISSSWVFNPLALRLDLHHQLS